MQSIQIHYNEQVTIPDWMLDQLNQNQLLARILVQRGVDTPDALQEFLNPDHYQPTEPDEFPNMEQAVQMIIEAVEKNQTICVYGDYDVDGITSTTILVHALRRIGAKVRFHLPHRFTEGYGMNERAVKRLAEEGVDLILTCDCGISNYHEIGVAKELGMQVIVTDHHHLPDELPPADAIVTPKLLPEEHRAHYIPGAGMAYYLALGVLTVLDRASEGENYLDLVSLAVVADVVPLQKENRYLLQQGLPLLAHSQRPGLQQLFQVCGIEPEELNEETIGFQIAPRLNAAGRIATAQVGVELLLAEEDDAAKGLARQLDQINTRRRELNEKMQEEAEALLGSNFTGRPIILYQPNWHEGVQGITASKLCETYSVPVLMMSLKEDGKTITGSARSIPGIHIYDALKECADFLEKFGGHAAAAGFSLQREKLIGFEKSMEQVLVRQLEGVGGVQEIEVDDCLLLSQITPKLYQDLQQLAPFGEANPVPKFLCPDAEVVYHRPTSNEKHLRLIFKESDIQFPAIWWWNGGAEFNSRVDLVYSIGLNRWQGREEIQLIVDQLVSKVAISKEMVAPEERLVFAIEDYRNWRELGEEFPLIQNAVYFVEGAQRKEIQPGGTFSNPSGEIQTMHRYELIQQENLVLLTIPPGLRIFKELIYMVRPKKVILAYSTRDLRSDVEFLKGLMGVVKYLIQQRRGKTNIYQLSTILGEMENTVTVGLKVLEEKGLIDVEFVGPDTLLLHRGDGQSKRGLKIQEKKLKALLGESRAFRNYLLEVDPERIKGLMR